MRKRFVALDPDLLPDVPIKVQVVAVESAQGTHRLIKSAGPEAPLILQVDEEVEHSLGADGREVGVRIVGGELLDPTVVSPASAFR